MAKEGFLKLGAVVAFWLLVSTTVVPKPSRWAGKAILREFLIGGGGPMSGVADMSPISSEIAVFAGRSSRRDGLKHPIETVPIYNYRHRSIPPVALSETTALIFPWPGIGLAAPPFFGPLVRYSPGGQSLLVYDGEGVVHLFQLGGGHPREVRTISLDLSADRPNFQPVDIEWSPDGTRIAVILSFKIFHEGVVRVYNVSTGKPEWERSFNFVEMGGEAWSPDGMRLAVTLLTGEPHTAYPPRSIPNLLVLDANSGRTLLSVTTGDQAGPVCFGPDDTVVTAPLHFEPHNTRWHHEEAKVWDATTGALTRQISSPGRDIHDDLELSRDGKVLLGYVGKERSGFVLKYVEDVNEVIDRKFQLYDYKTGNVIATSPDLTKNSGMCVNHMPAFRLSPHGRRVLVYWPNSGCAPGVFELQTSAGTTVTH